MNEPSDAAKYDLQERQMTEADAWLAQSREQFNVAMLIAQHIASVPAKL